MDPHERARKLVALATDGGASSEEARTAAMAACRLIVKHKLLDTAPDRHAAASRRPARGRPAPDEAAAHGRRESRSEERTSYRAARGGTCAFCAAPFRADDDIMTYPNGTVDHWHCAKRRAAGAEPGI